jgi:hypothetical protein
MDTSNRVYVDRENKNIDTFSLFCLLLLVNSCVVRLLRALSFLQKLLVFQ